MDISVKVQTSEVLFEMERVVRTFNIGTVSKDEDEYDGDGEGEDGPHC